MMTAKQIEIYEYCKKDIAQIKKWKESIPFGIQNHGCGSQVPSIEHQLEAIHREMYDSVLTAMNKASEKIEHIVNTI